MLFNSIPFVFFLPIVFGIYWLMGRRELRAQNAFLVIASYVFYGWWDWRFLSLIFISSLVDFLVGLRLQTTQESGARKALLTVSLVANLGMLGFFKYFNFFIESFANLIAMAGMHADVPTLQVVLPVGISFYTFQTLSYTIDLYRRNLEPTRDPIAFFAFVSFFPQLVAGPIERASNLLPQFQKPRSFDNSMARDGLRQVLNGYIKKMVIADNLAPHVQAIFEGRAHADSITLLIGVFFFAFQIYCDFSGYSDIAIGIARLFGFNLMRNFRFPYLARDIAEFWHRWHISLSTWFRDYVFIPLGGSRVSTGRRIFNIMVTFTVSGLWHGSNWTFVIWGALNGLYYLPIMITGKGKFDHEVAENRLLPGLADSLSMAATFLATLLAWIFFRARSLHDALWYIGGIFSHPFGGTDHAAYIPMLSACGFLWLVEYLQRDKQYALQIEGWPMPIRWTSYATVILIFLIFGNFGSTEFIYFQF